MVEPTKIITASAGTGKTYRLSLEYISILLNNLEVDFSEIVVITFTKKATFEIREKVFEHFNTLLNGESKDKKILIQNLEEISGTQITSEKLKYLERIYHQILKNKSQLQIKTNDSFIHSIFSQIIAPYLQIDEFSIDNNINDSYLNEIWDFVLNSEGLKIIKQLFPNKIKRNIEDYNSFLKSVINDQWIFEMDYFKNISFEVNSNQIDNIFEGTRKIFLKIIELVFEAYKKKNDGKHFSNWLKKDFNQIFELNENLNSEEYLNQIKACFNPKFLTKNYKLFLDKEIWNGNKFRAKSFQDYVKELQESNDNLIQHLIIYLTNIVLFPEMKDIYNLSKIVKQKYDEIKFRDKIFTYNDLQLYTYRYLYDKNYSLIENGNVTNEFYLRLSTKIRYLLFDEFQDTSIIQWKIFRPIINEIRSGDGSKDYGKCVIVGDEKQSIYRWRGGERNLITSLKNILKSTGKVIIDKLGTSFRSDKNVIDFVNKISTDISKNINFKDEWIYNNVKCHKKEEGFVNAEVTSIKDFKGEKSSDKKYLFYKNEIEEKLIKNIKNGKINPAKTAILARKNSTLLTIGSILEENGINFYLKSPHTVFQNEAIHPIIIALKFIVEPSIVNLLKLLRSDFVAFYPDEILAIYDKISESKKETVETQDFVAELESDLKNQIEEILKPKLSLVEMITNICEIFNWKDIFKEESSAKNLFYFIEIASTFTNTAKSENKTNVGFIKFIKENLENDNYKEKGLESVKAIQLLSIHRSKGLQWETVFVFWDFSERNFNALSLKKYLKFDENFSEITNAILTYSNDSIAKRLDIYDEINEKEMTEKLNLFYVAITRAEKNLYFCSSFNKKIKKSNDLKDVDQSIFYAINNLKTNSTDNSISYQVGKLSSSTDEKEMENLTAVDFSRYLDFSHSKKINKIYENNTNEEALKEEYLSERKQMKGIIVHYFLSQIKFNTENEIDDAEKDTYKFFANIIPKKMTSELILKSKNFLLENSDIFSQSKWDKVFNEYPIFITSKMREKFPQLTKKEYRIDRMMIDSKNNIIEIIDYKTGSVHDKLQVENYIKMVEMIDFVKENNYKVSGRFCELTI